uniref:GGDEF domain-containing protein n=1 Tax=Roseburia inulinivorans TaxID=360807 RepID=UPI00402685A5
RRSTWEYIRAVEYDYEVGNAGFVSIAIADIDFFKRINDTYGHDAGDEVLKAVAELFMDKMKTYGRVCRWGGEEFLFVFYGRNGDAAYDVLQEIYDEIHRLTVSYENEEIRITMTFGLEEYDKNDGMEMAIRRADEKLYQGKETGRDKIVY